MATQSTINLIRHTYNIEDAEDVGSDVVSAMLPEHGLVHHHQGLHRSVVWAAVHMVGGATFTMLLFLPVLSREWVEVSNVIYGICVCINKFEQSHDEMTA